MLFLIEVVTGDGVLIAGVKLFVIVGVVAMLRPFHEGGDINAGGGHREEAYRGEYAIASADVGRQDEALVAVFLG